MFSIYFNLTVGLKHLQPALDQVWKCCRLDKLIYVLSTAWPRKRAFSKQNTRTPLQTTTPSPSVLSKFSRNNGNCLLLLVGG